MVFQQASVRRYFYPLVLLYVVSLALSLLRAAYRKYAALERRQDLVEVSLLIHARQFSPFVRFQVEPV